MRRWSFHTAYKSGGVVWFCDLVVSGAVGYVIRWSRVPTEAEVLQAIRVATERT